MYYLNYFVKYNRSSLEWCFFGDCDEFFYLKDEYLLDDIINTYKDYDLIYFPWLIYGSFYHIENPQNQLVIDSFPLYEDFKFRQYKWYYYINKKRTEDNMVNKIIKNLAKII
jgi:hypothetical protein